MGARPLLVAVVRYSLAIWFGVPMFGKRTIIMALSLLFWQSYILFVFSCSAALRYGADVREVLAVFRSRRSSRWWSIL